MQHISKDKQIGLLTKELKEAQAQLKQQYQLVQLGTLVAGIVHEQRAPLWICGNKLSDIEIAVDSLKEYINTIEDSHFLEQLQEILDCTEVIRENLVRQDHTIKYSLALVSHHNPYPISLELNPLINKGLKLFAESKSADFSSRSPKLEIDLDSKIETIEFHKEDFIKVFNNLLSNAYDSLLLKLKTTDFTPQIKVSTRKIDNSISISVQDNGLGISEPDKIFAQFYTTKNTGIGLGLAISKEIADRNNWELSVSSELGKFAEFQLLIPVRSY